MAAQTKPCGRPRAPRRTMHRAAPPRSRRCARLQRAARLAALVCDGDRHRTGITRQPTAHNTRPVDPARVELTQQPIGRADAQDASATDVESEAATAAAKEADGALAAAVEAEAASATD